MRDGGLSQVYYGLPTAHAQAAGPVTYEEQCSITQAIRLD